MTKSVDINELSFDVAFLGGGIDSAVGSAHYAAIELDKKFKVVAGCFGRTNDINAASGRRYRISPERVYPTAESLLAAEKGQIDAVVILTPTDQHFAHARLFLENGIPVICEKAMTCTVSESQELAALVERISGFLSVIFNYTGYPIVREMREFIRAGKLGRLHQVNVEMPQEGYLRVDKDQKPISIQDWRLRSDFKIPVVSLDLGVHLHSIITFLTGERPLSVVAQSRSNGHFEGLDDNVMALIQCSGELDVRMWYGKTALGYRNGLRVEVFGSLGALSWTQEHPEYFTFADGLGDKHVYDRGCFDLSISRQDRYQRFKAGHPAGFIEALANYYWDVAVALNEHKDEGSARYFPNAQVFGASHALEGMQLMEAIHVASKDRRWVDVP